MIKNKLPLGTKVAFTAISVTTRDVNDHKSVIKLKREGEGFICGVRSMQEGYTTYEAFDAYGRNPVWNCTKHVDVYLVSGSYSQIVRVQPEDIIQEEK